MVIVARDTDGRLVHIKDATRGRRYTCLECREPLILKQGQKLAWHYAHHSDSNCSAKRLGYSETLQHLLGKEYVKAFVERRDEVVVETRCARCGKEERLRLEGRVEVEWGLGWTAGRRPGEGEKRADCAVFPPNGDQPVLVEIVHSHATDDRPGYTWVELAAADVVASLGNSAHRFTCRRKAVRCEPECRTLQQLAIVCGLLFPHVSDPEGEISVLYGKHQRWYSWHPGPPRTPAADWAELARRARCPRCGRPHAFSPDLAGDLYCDRCIRSVHYRYNWRIPDTKLQYTDAETAAIKDKYRWMNRIPKATDPHMIECMACGEFAKPTSYRGPRRICGECVLKQSSK